MQSWNFAKRGYCSCFKCDKGYYSPSGSNKCIECHKNAYAPEKGSAHCKKFPEGKVSKPWLCKVQKTLKIINILLLI